jgi:hypothetical protein
MMAVLAGCCFFVVVVVVVVVVATWESDNELWVDKCLEGGSSVSFDRHSVPYTISSYVISYLRNLKKQKKKKKKKKKKINNFIKIF